MRAEQGPLGTPAHLCKAAVSSPPLKHVVRSQEWDMVHWWLKVLFPYVESILVFGNHFLIRSRYLPCSHSSLVRPFVWRGLCPLNVLLARHHFSKKMLSNMRTSPNSLPPAIAFHSIQSVHLSACLPGTLLLHMGPSLLRLSLSFIFSFFKQKSCSCPFCLEHC